MPVTYHALSKSKHAYCWSLTYTNYYNSIKAHPTALIIHLCQTAIKSNELKPVSALAFSTLSRSWSCGRKGIRPVERRWCAAGGDLIGTGCNMIRIIYSCHLRQLITSSSSRCIFVSFFTGRVPFSLWRRCLVDRKGIHSVKTLVPAIPKRFYFGDLQGTRRKL